MSNALIQAGISTLKWIASAATRVLRNQKGESLIRFTGAARVEPITMIDQRLVHLPYVTDALQALTSIFSGYYLQAVALMVNVGNVNVLRLLDTLNPTRDVADAAATKIADRLDNGVNMLSFEAYEHGLPLPGQTLSLEAKQEKDKRPALPAPVGKMQGPRPATAEDVVKAAAGGDVDTAIRAGRTIIEDNADKLRHGDLPGEVSGPGKALGTKVGVQFGDSFKAVNEATNLSVGKLLEVTITNGDARASIPITVRLIATIVGSKILAHILGDGSRDITFKERYHAWRAGQLEFWRDLVMCQDLIDEHKRVLAKDESGVYDAVLQRRQGNLAAGALTSTPSIGTASNLVVISSQTAKELEQEIGGRLRDPKVRDKIFKSTYIMIMVVIDTEYEQVTFYHRGIALPTQLSVKELKAANKGTGPDVADILKAYQLGVNPSI